jgi:hypothetical protein
MATAVVAESCYDPRSDEVEAVDARLVALARGGAPLRRALARVAGEFGRRRAWEPLGFARAADYARERPGLSARELHDLAHVDSLLAKLPAIDAALSTGRLGWTKARLLCRVATPEDEARWLDAAGRLSATALAREVRAIDVGSLAAGAAEPDDDDAGAREVLRVRVPRRVKTKWGDVKRTVRRVAGEWLPNETCVELVAAEVLSAIRLEVDPEEPPPLAKEARSAASDPELVPAPLPAHAAPEPASPFVAALVADLEGADPRELDRRLCRAAALERGVLARIAPLLLALADARGPWQLGFRSLDAYARERLGLSPRKARALLRLERACALSPALREAWRAGAITGSQAQLLVPLVLAPGSEPFHPGWTARAAEVTVRRLEDDVEHALASGRFDPALLPELPEFPAYPAGVQTGAEPTARGDTDVWVAHVPAEVGRLFRACLCTVARRLGTPGAALEAMFDHFNDTWFCSTPRAYRVFERDGYRCTVPGCTAQRNLHAHHVLFRSRGGRDDLANLVTLCAAHHQRGVHRGVVRISGRAPEALVFELPLCVYRSGDRAVRAGATSVAGSTAG